MATTQTFETIIHLNAQEAKNEMADLQKRLDDLKRKKAEALRDPGTSVKDINKFNKITSNKFEKENIMAAVYPRP